MLKRTLLTTFLFVVFLTPLALAGDKDWTNVAGEIEAVLRSAGETYEQGKPKEAKALVSRAYFDLFEGEGMETAVSVHISESRKTDIEGMFAVIRGGMGAGEPASEVMERIDALVFALKEDAQRLPTGGGSKESPVSLFFNSFVIILREGFEAILVISALTAYLAKTGHKDKVRTVYKGALVALAASVLTAVLLQTVFSISGADKEALEGVTMLIATAVLFYVSYWLITKIEIGRWQRYIRSKVEGSLTKANLFALAFAAFLAVYREGAETILFYGALYSSSGGDGVTIGAGFVLGTVVLAGVFVVIKYTSVRVPIGPFFGVTSTLLYYLAFSFAGKGIAELQEAGWVSSTAAEGFPTIHFLGLYPTWEGIALQSLLFFALLVAVTYSFVIRPYRERVSAESDLTHLEFDIKTLHDMLEDVSEHAMKAHGLSSGVAGREICEARKHLLDIDSKAHEVMRHLTKFEKGLEDVFSMMERDIKKG